MVRLIPACLFLVWIPSATAAPDVADLKKRMPKDQLEYVEKLEEIAKLTQDARKESNALKQKEMHERAESIQGGVLGRLTRHAQVDGLKEWVVVAARPGPAGIDLYVPGLLYIVLEYEGMGPNPKATIRGLDGNEVLSITVAPNPKHKTTPGGPDRGAKFRPAGPTVKELSPVR